jgi:hypothetical protein
VPTEADDLPVVSESGLRLVASGSLRSDSLPILRKRLRPSAALLPLAAFPGHLGKKAKPQSSIQVLCDQIHRELGI